MSSDITTELPTLESWPTDWHMLDDILKIECRQLSADTYQLRSLSHSITLNSEGFNLYRDHTPQGQVIFEDWCNRNQIVSEPRDDVPSEALDDES